MKQPIIKMNMGNGKIASSQCAENGVTLPIISYILGTQLFICQNYKGKRNVIGTEEDFPLDKYYILNE